MKFDEPKSDHRDQSYSDSPLHREEGKKAYALTLQSKINQNT